GDFANVRDCRADIGMVVPRDFDRDHPVFDTGIPEFGLRVFFQRAADFLLNFSVTAADQSIARTAGATARAFSALDRSVARAMHDIFRFRDRSGASVPSLLKSCANA